MPDTIVTGAILAAGRGTRMQAGCDWLPKPLLPVGGRPILAHQLGWLRAIGVRRVAVLVGHRRAQVLDYLATTHGGGLTVDVVEQPSPEGAGHGLLCLRPRLHGPFVLFLGDIFIAPEDLTALVDPVVAGKCAASIAVTRETDTAALQKNFRVDVDADGRVVRVVEKPTTAAPALKGCGVYALTPAIFPAIERTARNARGEIGITEPIQTLVDSGAIVRTARVSGWDVNLTTPEDLRHCNRTLLDLQRQRRIAPC